MKISRRAGVAAVLVAAGAIGGGAATQQNMPTSGVKVVAASQAMATASRPVAAMMMFRFEDAAVEDVLREVTAKLGIVIEKEGVVPGRVSVVVPEAVDADQAVGLLDTILLSVRYAAVEVHREGDERRILRVMTFEEAKKEAPVTEILGHGATGRGA